MSAIGPGAPARRDAASPTASPPPAGSEGGQGLLPAELGTLPGEATLDAAAAASEGPRSPVRALAGSLMGAFRRPRPDAPSPEAAGENASGSEDVATPARSPARRLAGSLLSTFARRPAGHGTEEVRTDWAGPDEDQQDGPGHTEPEGDAGRRRLRSPLHGIADRFQAALRSLSPPRTADRDAEPRTDTAESAAADSSAPNVPRSLPAASPARSPLATARSLPENTGPGASRIMKASTAITAANRFKRGLKRPAKREVERIPEILNENEQSEVDFGKALQQAEDGILRDLHKENRVLWKLDRAGVLEEVVVNFKNHVKKSAALFEFVDFDYSNEEEEVKERVMQERYVRCFVSAPYSDMQAERRLLAQEVFPALRQRCMEIGVHFMEVDFCWGVPESIAERKSNIMERMLEMRQNIKTYIIGIVAERYGYSYLMNATPGHLAQDPMYVGKRAAVLGLQEIELDEGPLARDIPHTAFYYCRDSRYLDEVEDAQVRSSLQSEGLLSRERLSHLKAKLHLSNIPLRENYKNPEDFASLALKDLTQKIIDDFPHETTKEMLIEVDEQLMHEFEESTLKTFNGREEEMSQLDDRVLAVQTNPGPTVLVGEEGVGKSAVMVAWNRRFAKKHSFDYMYKRYAGLNTESGCWASIVRGILQGMKDKFKLRKDIPNEIQFLPGAFSLWLGIMASLSARVIIMIDAVEKIHDIQMDCELEPPPDDDEEDDDDHPLERQPRLKPPHDLFWLPTIVPPNVRILVSVTKGSEAHKQLVERKWGVYELKPIDDESRKVMLAQYIKSRGLEMPEGLQSKLLERGPAKRPLFLVTILRSLQVPDDMKPTGALGTFLYARGMKELAHMVMDRLENLDGLQERRGLVEEALSCIALSRRGLSELEVIGMLQVPRALFTKFYLQTRNMFQVFFGMISFSSVEFDLEIRRRYLVHDEVVVMIRSRIASYFTFRPLSTRTVEEVPWQLFQSRKWTELAGIVSNPEIFMILTNSHSGVFDLIIYWEALTLDPHDGGGGINIVDKMEDCMRRAKESSFPIYEQVALFISSADLLQRLKFYDIAMTYFRRACDLEDREIGLSAVSKIEYMLKETRIFLRKGDFAATRRMYDRTIKALTDVVDTDGDGQITYEELKATDAGTLLLDTEEELMFMLYEGQHYSSLEGMCLHMLGREEDRPTNELLLFDVLINTYMESGKLDSAMDFIVRALAAIPNPECDECVHVLGRKLGLCLMRGNYLKAIEIVEDSGWIFEAIDGGDEENLDELIDILAFYCCALTQSGRADDAVRILATVVQKQFPPEDEDENTDDSSSSSGSELSSISHEKRDTRAERVNVIVSDVMLLDIIGIAQREIYDLEEAEAHHKKALSLKVLSHGPKDASNAYTLSELACLYEHKRDASMSLKMRQAACAIIKECLGDKNSRYYMALQAQAACHWKFGDFTTARHMANVVHGGVERSFGSRSEMLPGTLLLLGLVLTSQGELREAERFLQRSQDLATSIWGDGCVAASNALFAIALVEERKGEWEFAELKLRQTMQAREDQIGPLHSYLQQDMAATSLLYFRIEAFQEVEDLLRTALPAMQAVHGPNALCVAGILSLLALVHARMGIATINNVTADPVALALRALRIRRKLLGHMSTSFKQQEMLTALLLAHLGDHRRAEPLFRKSYVRATTLGKAPHDLRWLLYQHMHRSGELGFEDGDRPKQPAWTPDYEDLTIELAELFDRLDTNKNGLLSKNELRNGLLAEGYELQDIQQRLPALFASMDKDGDGEISKDEFVAHFDAHEKLLSPIHKRGALINAVNMGRLFDRLDVDKNRLLSRNELRDGLLQEGYDMADITRRLPMLFSSMDKDGDGEITKQEFVAHFDANKGFSPVPYLRTPKVDASISETAKPEEKPKAEAKDIVDMVLEDIHETADARKGEEGAPASARSRRPSARSSLSQGEQRHGTDDVQDRGEQSPAIRMIGKDQPDADDATDDMKPPDRLPLSDYGGMSRGASSHSLSRSLPRASTSSSVVASSVGTEQAREELQELGTSVVDMMDDIFAGVVSEFPVVEYGDASERLVLDGAELQSRSTAHGPLRPLSAPGARRKLSRLEGLPTGARPQTAGSVRRDSALHAILLSGSDEDEEGERRGAAIPRLSMTAVGRARRMRAGINAQDEAGNTSLHLAVRDNDADAVKSLLEAGANASTANLIGQAPIHLAAKAGNARIAKLLAPAVSNINQQGPDGFSALHYAVESASLALVQSLCETFGADISSQTNNGETPALLAERLLGPDSRVTRYLVATMEMLPAL